MSDGGELLRRWEDGEINALQFCEQAAEAIRALLAENAGLRQDVADFTVALDREIGTTDELEGQLDAARTALTARDRALRTIMAWRPGDHGAERFKPWEIAAAALSEEPTP